MQLELHPGVALWNARTSPGCRVPSRPSPHLGCTNRPQDTSRRARVPGEVAERYRYQDGAGEVGVIASVTQPFCRTCTRARLSAKGELFTCLFGSRGHDLRALLRDGSSDSELEAAISGFWQRRTDRYSEQRTDETTTAAKVEMSYIGG